MNDCMRDRALPLKRELLTGRRCLEPLVDYVIVNTDHVLYAFAAGVVIGFLIGI